MMKKVIEAWLFAAIEGDRWKTYFDLHIDQINQKYTERSNWVIGSKKSLQIASNSRDIICPEFTVAIGMSLVESADLVGGEMQFNDSFIDWTPPSLYLFNPGWEDWLEIEKNSVLLSNIFFGIEREKVLYIEYFNVEFNEIRKSLFVASLPKHLEYI